MFDQLFSLGAFIFHICISSTRPFTLYLILTSEFDPLVRNFVLGYDFESDELFIVIYTVLMQVSFGYCGSACLCVKPWPCERDGDWTVRHIVVKLKRYANHDEMITPIDFDGQRVKVTIDNLVNI